MAVTSITSFLDEPVDGLTDNDPNAALTGTEATLATLNLTIPSHWSEYTVHAAANCSVIGAAATTGTVTIKTRIDGTDGSDILFNWASDHRQVAASTQQRETGLTSTGSIAILLRADTSFANNVDMRQVQLYAIARRTG